MKQFDYIIVGGGSAGCVLADKLSACGKYEVCLLEAGPKDDHWSIKVPLGVIELMKSKTLNWSFNSHPEKTLNEREVFNPRGRTLGGSSAINAMLYVRGQKEDYDHWASLGNEGWSFEDVLPYFRATQHQERGDSDLHGTSGELNVADSRSKPVVSDEFISAAHGAGYPLNDDFNGENQEGVGYYQVTQKNGQRCSAAHAFLTPNLGRKNLTVITDATVQKILMEGKKAVGICYLVKGNKQEIHCKKEVIISAGAFGSPQLLMLSGIGNEDKIAPHGIEHIHQLDGVGENLQDHVDIMTVKHFRKTELLAYRPKAMWWAVKQSVKYFTDRTGLLTSVVAEAGGFIKSDKSLETPDLQLHFIPAAMDDHGRNAKMLFNYGISLHACLLRPKSRGSVSLYGANPLLHPKIDLNMLSHHEDIATMIKAVGIARNILMQEPLSKNTGDEIFPGSDCQTDEDILSFLQEKANTIYHPVGTCKMGNDNMAVVDNELRVHGLEALRVVDASIMPTLISGNTNAPTIMVAAKAADLILASA